MGLLQKAYETYEMLAGSTEAVKEGQTPLLPMSHIVQNAQIEITIDEDGCFLGAVGIEKEAQKTIIPATEASSGRVGDNSVAHPLCDQLRYLAPYGGKKYLAYTEQLKDWAESSFAHQKVLAVLRYVEKGTIVRDLADCDRIQMESDTEVPKEACGKYMVRWRVVPPPEGVSSACWEDKTLFDRYIEYNRSKMGEIPRDVDYITGETDVVESIHPKGIVSSSYGAKLVSSNDSSGFTYRGRFTKPEQAGVVGYCASQKAHSALQWLAANQGVLVSGRVFICWNPQGKPVPRFGVMDFDIGEQKECFTFESYREKLRKSISGYRLLLDRDSDVVIAAFDAATTGRLSLTYYSEVRASDFFDRLERWYESCCWYSRLVGNEVWRPTIRQIVNCAFGTQRENYITTDDRVLKEQTQRLLHCIVDDQPLPWDVVRALAERASTPQAYKGASREVLLSTACAAIRKYHNDKDKEKQTMALDKNCPDRSYLFGRLLAVAEKVENTTYADMETRETNAIRMQSRFCQRPMQTWRDIEQALNPYFVRLVPGLRNYYKNIIGEIVDKLPEPNDASLDKKLDDVYLLGYYLQRTALNTKKEKD